MSGAGITAMVTGQVQHISVDEAYARGYEKRYGKDGFMLLVPAPQDLITGEPNQSGLPRWRFGGWISVPVQGCVFETPGGRYGVH